MKFTPILVGAFTLALAVSASAQTITIATVNNGDMVRMQGLSVRNRLVKRERLGAVIAGTPNVIVGTTAK